MLVTSAGLGTYESFRQYVLAEPPTDPRSKTNILDRFLFQSVETHSDVVFNQQIVQETSTTREFLLVKINLYQELRTTLATRLTYPTHFVRMRHIFVAARSEKLQKS